MEEEREKMRQEIRDKVRDKLLFFLFLLFPFFSFFPFASLFSMKERAWKGNQLLENYASSSRPLILFYLTNSKWGVGSIRPSREMLEKNPTCVNLTIARYDENHVSILSFFLFFPSSSFCKLPSRFRVFGLSWIYSCYLLGDRLNLFTGKSR